MNTRRRFLQVVSAAGTGAYLSSKSCFWPRALAEIRGGSLPPDVIPKFVTPPVIPPAMPRSASDSTIDYYEIAVRQFAQQILPARMPQTTVWGYGSLTDERSFNYPAFTIEATANRMVRVKWMNQLVDRRGNYLPHLSSFTFTWCSSRSSDVKTPMAPGEGLRRGRWEPKDTMISYPGEISRVKATFDRAGHYVWHCHIVEHEDNEMMRPFSVGPIQRP